MNDNSFWEYCIREDYDNWNFERMQDYLSMKNDYNYDLSSIENVEKESAKNSNKLLRAIEI